ncbi:PTS system mannose/fructose/sorbose family transporter subunit IID [Criibacterium bergeronii]|uniref:PTS system mannose/fructose/sorbose family transporter subunit IID n=1 Tax=Criibacterium bergeronii TaxID=1871336 RepID=UPI0028063452|nr:PTS system mannose/fructose/sorbose family transporter subunit IID [Criibacterium bergeronii]
MKDEKFETINCIKLGLFGPIAGIGYALFWFTILPIVAGITSSLAMEGNALGPIIFFIVYLVIFLCRIPLANLGYKLGVKALDFTNEQSAKISRAATILGVTVIGGLIASYVNIDVLSEITTAAGNVVKIQSDLLDKIIPNFLPVVYTFLMYYLLKKKMLIQQF